MQITLKQTRRVDLIDAAGLFETCSQLESTLITFDQVAEVKYLFWFEGMIGYGSTGQVDVACCRPASDG